MDLYNMTVVLDKSLGPGAGPLAAISRHTRSMQQSMLRGRGVREIGPPHNASEQSFTTFPHDARGSVAAPWRGAGNEVISMDINPECAADIAFDN